MKTGDPQGPWVRIPPSPPFTTESPFTNFALEKYSRGRRGAPAKGVGRETGARVQIPPSPPEKAPHESAGLFTLFSGFGPERREARAKSSSAACGGYSENFLALRSAKPRRYRPPTAAPGTARGPAKQVQIPPSPPEKAPHESAGLFTLFSGFGPERREARAKSSSAACGGYSENFLALRSAKPRRYRPPTAAPGTARGPAKQVQIPPSPPEKAPHESAGLFILRPALLCGPSFFISLEPPLRFARFAAKTPGPQRGCLPPTDAPPDTSHRRPWSRRA